MIPYGRHCIDEDDVRAVAEVLRGDRITCGPCVDRFERAVARWCGAAHGVAVNSGTSALHCAMHALGVGPGDEVVVSTFSFAATASCVCFTGATPVFCDVDPHTLLMTPESLRERITERTKAVIAVDFAGQPCEWDGLRAVGEEYGLPMVADACHALGADLGGRRVGTLADITVFSFHPVKHITTGEGGMCLTEDAEYAARMRSFRSHCVDVDEKARSRSGSWEYDVAGLGYNYRITDIQCALGLSQFGKLESFVARRRAMAARYDEAFASMDSVMPLQVLPQAGHAYHLYVVQVDPDRVDGGRNGLFDRLQASGIGVNVHYKPIHLHSHYRETFGTGPGTCPDAEGAFERVLTLPCHPCMSDEDVETVIRAVSRNA